MKKRSQLPDILRQYNIPLGPEITNLPAHIKDAVRGVTYLSSGLIVGEISKTSDSWRFDPDILKAPQMLQDYAFSGTGIWDFFWLAQTTTTIHLYVSAIKSYPEIRPKMDPTFTNVAVWLLAGVAYEALQMVQRGTAFDTMDMAGYLIGAGLVMTFNAAASLTSNGIVDAGVRLHKHMRDRSAERPVTARLQ